jgi:hypothetical protein
MTEELSSLVFLRRPARALLPFALSCLAACIDVGHPAEVGCLVDPTEPGCTPPDETEDDETEGAEAGTSDASSADAGASANAR